MALRTRLGLTQEEFGARIGLQTKGSVSLAERGLKPISADVALAIETLSDGTINASALNAIVARARGQEGLFDHGMADTANMEAMSPGKAGDNFPVLRQAQDERDADQAEAAE
jgi:transcriptional regulator with XRE-family HTH domain